MTEQRRTLLELMGLLRNLVVRVGVHRTATGRRLGLTNQQMGLLGIVLRDEGCTVGEAAAQSYLPLPAVSRSFRALERRGLVARRREAADQRVVRLYLTPDAVPTVEQIHREVEAILDRLLARMTKTEQRAVLLGVGALVDALVAIDEEPTTEDSEHEHDT